MCFDVRNLESDELVGYAIFSMGGNYRSVRASPETVGGPMTIKSTAILLPGCVVSAIPRAKHCFSHQRSVEIHQLHSVCSLIFCSKCQGNKKAWRHGLEIPLCNFDYRNKGIRDLLLQKWGGNSFIPSYLLAVAVVQMFFNNKIKMPNHKRSLRQEYVGKGTGTPLSEGSSHHNWQLNNIFLFKLTTIKCLSQQQMKMFRRTLKRVDAKIIIQDGFAKLFLIKKGKRLAFESWKMLYNVMIPCFDLSDSSAVQQKT